MDWKSVVTKNCDKIIEPINKLEENNNVAENYKEKISFNSLQIVMGKNIIGSCGGNINPSKDIKELYNKIKKNKINLNKFYGKVFNLNQINKAIKYMITKKSYERILIKF